MRQSFATRYTGFSYAAGLIVVAAFLSACTETPPPDAASDSAQPVAVVERDAAVTEIACEEVGSIKPICGFHNPEDLAVVPGGNFLLVSEMGAFMSDAPNTISLLDIAKQQRVTIGFDWQQQGDRWGDPVCAAPDNDKFSPHGIDLITREDGRHQLLVVNHGNEQIEFFELLENQPGKWSLNWKGCAKPPGDPFINDVAGLIDGGFLATHMWNKSTPFEQVVASLNAGEKTGWVWEWQADTGFTKLPNSDELMPNGIAVSKDNSKIFVNIYMGNKTIKLDRASGLVEGEFAVRSPDNIVVDDAGSLWVASHLNDPVEGRCEDGHAGPCLLPFQVIKADPQTMVAEIVFRHEGEPMGYATVALPHGGRLYLGSASGDRVASIDM